MRRPGTFDAAGHRIAADAAGGVVVPSEPLLGDVGALGLTTDVGRRAVAVGLANARLLPMVVICRQIARGQSVSESLGS